MLSRVAESIYWMSRYIERAENVARFIHVNLNLELDLAAHDGNTPHSQWQPLIWTTGDEKVYVKRYGEFSRENVIKFLTFDVENPNSIVSCVKWARENARSVREVISSEMWITLNRFYLMLHSPDAEYRAANDPHTFYTDVKTASALFIGESMITMSHGEAWHFARLARLIERADKTSRILDVKYFILLPTIEAVGMPIDTIQWATLLKSASALEMYRKRFYTITPRNVSEFLILDREFPRAVLHCVVTAEESVRALTGTRTNAFSNPAEQALGHLRADLQYTQMDDIMNRGMHEYIDSIQTRLNKADDAINRTFFEVSPTMQSQSQTQTQS